MNYQRIDKDNFVNGPGIRTVLWISGCSHYCKGCHNPETWDYYGGKPFDSEVKKELFKELEKDYISGISFSGGDPLSYKNRVDVGKLIKEISEKFPKKNIWVWTGFLYEDLLDYEYLKYIDVLVDGEFKEELKDPRLKYCGSTNQRIIKIKESLEKGEVNLYEKK